MEINSSFIRVIMVFSTGSDDLFGRGIDGLFSRGSGGLLVSDGGIGLFDDCGGNSILQREDLKELPVCLIFE